jgi:hypothetical protein
MSIITEISQIDDSTATFALAWRFAFGDCLIQRLFQESCHDPEHCPNAMRALKLEAFINPPHIAHRLSPSTAANEFLLANASPD